MKNPVSNPIENQAAESGKLFALSEIDAARSFEMFARAIGETPDYATWIANRTDWVASYVETKPNAKGNSADQAFSRFAKRLLENFPTIKQPAKSDNPAAVKKAEERAKKAEALAQRFDGYTDSQITGMLRTAYEEQAKNPTKKNALLKELEMIAKQRTKKAEAESGEALKEARTRLFDLAKAWNDVGLINTAADILDTANFDVTYDGYGVNTKNSFNTP